MYLIALKPSWTVERIQSIFNAFTAATNGAIKVGNSSLIIKCYFRILKYSIFNWVFFLNSVGGRAKTVQIRYPYNFNPCK